MKTLVVYYSRSGITKKVAEQIAQKLKADVDEVIDRKDRSGIIGFLSGGKDAMQKAQTEITFSKKPESYDLVVVGSPVWGNNMAPAIRTFLTEQGAKLKKTAFFCTSGRSGIESTLNSMGVLVNKKSVSTMGLTGKEIKGGYEERLSEFVSLLKK